METKKEDPLDDYSPFDIFFSEDLREELKRRARTKRISADTLYRGIVGDVFGKDFVEEYLRKYYEYLDKHN